MRIVGNERLSFGVMVGKIQPPLRSATFFLKATFKLRPSQPAIWAEEPDLVCGDIYTDGDREKNLLYPSDFAPLKPRADVMLVATAHAPGNKPTMQFDVAFRTGRLTKTLRLLGKRTWKKGVGAPLPEPFVSLSIGYDQSFGGAQYARNPIGKGHLSESAPQVENPQRLALGPGDDVEPAGFGPLPPSWPQRSALCGTYDETWVKERWPWFPKDFDFAYFNAAPRDQQVEGYLRGDEAIEFHNLHPEHAVYRSRLPGVRARCFLDEELDGVVRFREVPQHLDTVWIDLNQEKLILVWRGNAEVATMKLREVLHAVIVAEPVSDPWTEASVYHTFMIEQISDRDVKFAQAESVMDDPESGDQEFKALDEVFAGAESDVAKADSAALDGLDPSWKPVVPPPPQTLAEAKASLFAQIAEMRAAETSDPGVLNELEQEAATYDELSRMEDEMNQSMADEEPWTRERVVAAAADSQSLAGQDLGDLDLSGLNLAHLDLHSVRLSGANLRATDFSGANLRRADLAGTDLSAADLTQAVLDGADLSGATLTGAKLTGTSIADALLCRLELVGADFSEARGDGANFSQSNLRVAKFTNARLPQADFSGCQLEAADFRFAHLRAAQFDGVVAPGINMEGAQIEGLHASEKADFSGGSFRLVKGSGSIWEQSILDSADFTGADLSEAQFPDARAQACRFEHANLTNTVFDDALLVGAVLRGANLLRASFDRSDLRHADAEGANLYESGFCEADTSDFNVRGAFIKGTQLESQQ